MSDAPRPYAVRPPLAEKTIYGPGDRLEFGLILAGRAIDFLPHLLVAFQTLGEMGLGVGQGKAQLLESATIHPLDGRQLPLLVDGVMRNEVLLTTGDEIMTCALRLPTTCTLHFATPMRIKHNGQFAGSPECHVLVRAALRRVSQLCAFFGEGPWEVPFVDLIRQAEGVRLAECRTHWVDWSRTSGATGQHMTLGGFVGSATYVGVPPTIRAVLLAGALLHVGKAVVFGHGHYTIDGLP